MTATIVNSKYAAGSTGTSSSITITAPSASNTLLVAFEMPNANMPIVSVIDNQGNVYVQDAVSTINTNHSGYKNAIYRCDAPANAPTTISVVGTSGSFSANFFVQEVSGLSKVAPLSQVSQSFGSAGGNSVTTNTLTLTTATDNEFIFWSWGTNNGRTLASVSAGCVGWGTTTVNFNGMSKADAGVAGSTSLTYTLSGGASAACLTTAYKTVTILPSMSISDTSVDSQAGTATVTVALDSTFASNVTVDYATANDTAIAGVHYTAQSGTLTFTPGQTSKTITVPITP